VADGETGARQAACDHIGAAQGRRRPTIHPVSDSGTPTGDIPGAQAGSRWLFTGRDGKSPGWRANASWRDVRVAARVLGRCGLTLFAAGRRGGRHVST
jgi:hypothetical protein